MSTRTYWCVGCGKPAEGPLDTFCACGHFIDVHYDLARVTLRDCEDPLVRYADLLPLEDPSLLVGPSHGPTPCRHARALGARWGLSRLFVKDETGLPTCTTKDRMARMVVSLYRAAGIKHFTASSTGNSSTALAHMAVHAPELGLLLFVGEAFLPYLQVPDSAVNVRVRALRGATFVEAGEEARRHAERHGMAADRGFFSIGRREGLKTAFLEAAEALPDGIDWYVQAVSSAMGVYGAYKGARELVKMGMLPRTPRLLCVQQTSNSPMVRAFQDGHADLPPEYVVANPSGIARSILRGDPSRVYPPIRRLVLESGGTMVSVDEPAIREARFLLRECEGLSCCYTAATALAGLGRMAREGCIASDATIVVNLTGKDRQPVLPRFVEWMEREREHWILASC